MPLPHPSVFYPELTDDRLGLIATKLLDTRYTTLQEMASPIDDNYTRETAVFGRSKNALIAIARDPRYPWVSLANPGMDVTINIGRVPCRFYRDDPEHPGKDGFFKRNAIEDLFPPNDQIPLIWRFVLESALTEDDEDRVLFLGFNAFNERVSEWVYHAGMPVIHAIGGAAPASADIPSPEIDLHADTPAVDTGTEHSVAHE